LSREQIERLLLPLGDFTKDEVRQIARSLNLPAAERPESQEICFVEGNDYNAFIEQLAPESVRPGLIVNADGKRSALTKECMLIRSVRERASISPLSIPICHTDRSAQQ